MHLHKYKTGFTLAETLITLMIIGILAMVTIKPLLADIEKQKLKSQFKTSQSIIYQAFALAVNDQGPLYHNVASNGFVKIMKPYFKNVSDYKSVYTLPSYSISTYNLKNPMNTARYDDGQFVINNNQQLFFDNGGTNAPLMITVDINGKNGKPNVAGHDIFTFEVLEGDILAPEGAQQTFYAGQTNYYCDMTTTHTGNGLACAYFAIQDKCPDGSNRGYWECLPD